MWWIRFVVVALVAGFGYCDYLAWTYDWSETDKLGMPLLITVVSSPFIIASILTFVASFFKYETRGGLLVISQESRYIRFLKLCFSDRDWSKPLNMCSLFWMTLGVFIFSLVILALVTTIVAGVVAGIGKVAEDGISFPEGPGMETYEWRMVGVVAGMFILFFTGIILAGNAAEKKVNNWLGIFTLLLSVLMSLCFVFVALPMTDLVYKRGMSPDAAWEHYTVKFAEIVPQVLLWGGVAIVGIAVLIGTIFVIFTSVKALHDSALGQLIGQWYHAFKTGTCPMIALKEEIDKPVSETTIEPNGETQTTE